jgi:hypothetical protein
VVDGKGTFIEGKEGTGRNGNKKASDGDEKTKAGREHVERLIGHGLQW